MSSLQYNPYNFPDQAPRTFWVRLQAQLKHSVIFMLLLRFYAKIIILSVFVRDLSFNQNMNAASSNCSYGFYSFPHQHSPPMSGNWYMTQRELYGVYWYYQRWFMLGAREICPYPHKGEQQQVFCGLWPLYLMLPTKSAWSCPPRLKRGASSWQVSAPPWPCRDLGGEQAVLSGLEHMAPWNGGQGEVQS